MLTNNKSLGSENLTYCDDPAAWPAYIVNRDGTKYDMPLLWFEDGGEKGCYRMNTQQPNDDGYFSTWLIGELEEDEACYANDVYQRIMSDLRKAPCGNYGTSHMEGVLEMTRVFAENERGRDRYTKLYRSAKEVISHWLPIWSQDELNDEYIFQDGAEIVIGEFAAAIAHIVHKEENEGKEI